MSKSASMQVRLGPLALTPKYEWSQENFKLIISVECPYCGEVTKEINDWGFYETTTGDVKRFMCKGCGRTFNPAKIPFWLDKMKELIWKLAQMAIKGRSSVNALAKIYEVPETTLRTLITAIKDFLASNFEIAKQLQERLSEPSTMKHSDLRVIFYDEGFIKLLGANGFIIFSLAANGTPINVAIEPKRNTETIHGYFTQAMTQLGGIDVIIGDGAPAILAAAKALRQELIVVQQIHKGKGKLARITQLETIPNKKRMLFTTIGLHTGALLPNVESIITVKQGDFYPSKFSALVPKQKNIKRKKKKYKPAKKRISILTPIEGASFAKGYRKTKTKILKGHSIFLKTGKDLNNIEINYIPGRSDADSKDCPSLIKIHSMLAIVQKALPKQFITSNRAEVFNALHDRSNVYWGRKSLNNANRDIKAWASITFFPDGSRALLDRYRWNIPYRLLFQLWPLMISHVQIS